MTAAKTRQRRTPAKAEAPLHIASLAGLLTLKCGWCPVTFAAPDADSFAEVRARAVQAGWLYPSGMPTCPSCAAPWYDWSEPAPYAPPAAEVAHEDEAAGAGHMTDCGTGEVTLSPDAVEEITAPDEASPPAEPALIAHPSAPAGAALYRLDSATHALVPVPAASPLGELEPDREANLAAFEAAHAEQDAAEETPDFTPDEPVQPVPEDEPHEPALDEAPQESAE